MGITCRHRAVHILIFNPAGDLYLQQRSRWKDRHPLKWDTSAAGHLIAAESYDETAQRELKEELGISVSLKKIAKLPASERTDQEFVWLYRGEVAGNLSPNRTEIETGAFFPENGHRWLGRGATRRLCAGIHRMLESLSPEKLQQSRARLLKSDKLSPRQTAQSRSLEFPSCTLRLQFAAIDTIAKHLGYDFISAKEVDLKTMRLFLRACFCVDAANVCLRIRIGTSSHNES